MALKRKFGNRKIENVEWTVPVHTGTFKHLRINTPEGADAVILAKLTTSGLVPYALCLSHQIDPDKLEEILHTDREVSQIVAIPFRRDERIDLVQGFNVVETVGYEAEPCCQRPSTEPTMR